MLRTSRWFALLLLTVWFSATQHCELASLGWPIDCAESRASGEPCTKDGCDQIENGSYQAQAQLVKALPPALVAIDPFRTAIALASLTMLTPPEPSPATAECPRNWVTTWHFVRRAAPPSRAPALLHA